MGAFVWALSSSTRRVPARAVAEVALTLLANCLASNPAGEVD
jgi:hypothetical protein